MCNARASGIILYTYIFLMKTFEECSLLKTLLIYKMCLQGRSILGVTETELIL